MMFGFTAFTCLGFDRLGTGIGLIATIIVALASEISFVYDKREEEGIELKDERHMVWRDGSNTNHGIETAEHHLKSKKSAGSFDNICEKK
jgi:hypothetical protein